MSNKQLQIPCTEIPGNGQISQSMIFKAVSMTNAVWRSGDKGTITISFEDPEAAWSHIGRRSSVNNPSMNLGFIDPPYGSFEFDGVTYKVPADSKRNYCSDSGGPKTCKPNWVPGATVVHEFGHALGMLHEHQNNLNKSSPIKL